MTTETGTRELTDLQQLALSTHEAAQAAGMTFTAYARSQGLTLRPLYDATVGLRRRGLLPGAVPAKRRARPTPTRAAAFVAIEVARPAAGTTAAVLCRLIRADGTAVECGAWPDPAWARAVLAVRADAAA